MEVPHIVTAADCLMLATGISPPWRLSQYRIDAVTKTVHLWITRHHQHDVVKKRSWFGFGPTQTVAHAPEPQAPANGPEMQWRYLNVMTFECHIHTTDRLDEQHHDLPWFGQPGLPFSNRLSHRVFICLAEGMEMSTICDLLNITFADLWKFKYALDKGLVKFEHKFPKKPAMVVTPASSMPVTSTSSVPDVTDPLWERLITGELDIEIKTLGLQLMFTKLRQQFSLQQSEEVKLMKLRELHRYVERNQRGLTHELRQIREQAQAESV